MKYDNLVVIDAGQMVGAVSCLALIGNKGRRVKRFVQIGDENHVV